jgi:glucose-6-phosphate 1-dehydrogenase
MRPLHPDDMVRGQYRGGRGAGRAEAAPQRLFDDSLPTEGRANDLRFRLSPNAAVALAARVKRAGKEFVGDQRELYLSEELPCAEMPYERLLGAAIAGNGALFTREDAVEAAWGVVDLVLRTSPRAIPYEAGTSGPDEADALIAADGHWHNPRRAERKAPAGAEHGKPSCDAGP